MEDTEVVKVVKSSGAYVVGVVAICVIFKANLWPAAVVCVSLALVGLCAVILITDKNKKY